MRSCSISLQISRAQPSESMNTKTIKRMVKRWKKLGKSAIGTEFPLVKIASVVHYTQWESKRLASWSTRVIGSYVVKSKT